MKHNITGLMTYNEIVKSCLKTERSLLIPKVVDKIGLKRYAKHHKVATPPIIHHDTDTYVLKATNDSGGTMIVEDGKIVSGSLQRVYKHRHTPFGVAKGEWFYSKIKPRYFKERHIGHNITDYKFHCWKGRVVFCQIIGDRRNSTSECLYLSDGTKLDYILDEKFKFGHYDLPENYQEMISVAEKLSAPFKYVRVDLFSIPEINVGELTFAPRAGNYTGEGQEKLGELFK